MQEEEKKKLSIIVPVFNVEPYIERCLRSLLDQDIPQGEYEIIVVDDGTLDNSAIIAQRIADENENIIVVHRENGGLSAARNTGLEYAKGKYIFFVDSDDYIERHSLGQLVDTADNYSAEVCSIRVYKLREDGSIYENEEQPFKMNKVYKGSYAIMHGLKISTVWQYLFLHSFLDKYHLRFYPGVTHEDIEFNYRMFVFANKVIFTNQFVYYYCYNGSSIMRGRTRKSIESSHKGNLYVAYRIKQFVSNQDIPKEVINLYERRMNSLIVSLMFKMLRDLDGCSKKFAYKFLVRAKGLGIYPVRGRTMSKRTDKLRFLINIESLFRFMIFIKKDTK